MIEFRLAQISGATSGIGEALARLLAEEGIPLFLLGRNEEKLEELKKELEKKVPVTILKIDLTSPDQRGILFKEMEKRKPDLIINNAGVGAYGRAISLPIDVQRDLVELNSKAPMEISIYGASVLERNNLSGVIFNVSSSAAFYTFPLMAAYSASKAFLNSFSLALDLELQKYNIRVLTICPGKVKTPFFSRAVQKKLEYQDTFAVMSSEFTAKEILKQIKKKTPLRIIDWKYRIAYFLSKFVPKKLSSYLLMRIISKRKSL